jgi:hypothetical protein
VSDERPTTVTRVWTDDSGKFQVTGRLVALLDTKIRIVKTDTRTCTVLIDRLSESDREYVRAIQSRMESGERLEQIAE